jgi:hypothetical protein
MNKRILFRNPKMWRLLKISQPLLSVVSSFQPTLLAKWKKGSTSSSSYMWHENTLKHHAPTIWGHQSQSVSNNIFNGASTVPAPWMPSFPCFGFAYISYTMTADPSKALWVYHMTHVFTPLLFPIFSLGKQHPLSTSAFPPFIPKKQRQSWFLSFVISLHGCTYLHV